MQLAVGYTGFFICNKGGKKDKHNSPFFEAFAVLLFYCLFLLLSFVYILTLHCSFIEWNIPISYT